MPLDIGLGRDDVCPACGNSGMCTDRMPQVEAQRIVRDKYPDAVVTYAHTTRLCDCRHGAALKKLMYKEEPGDV